MSQSLMNARDHLEEQVRRRTLQLTQTNNQLEAYSYSIAHDLRTPLRAITGFSQILLADAGPKLNAQEQDSLRRIANAGAHMAKLIDEILELSRVTRVDMQTELVDLSALSENIARQFAETEPKRNIKWAVQPAMTVHGDRRLLSLVMENLIGNAFKYTASKPRAEVEIATTRVGGDNVHYVRDNGVGFDMQYYDKLFKPFQRLHGKDEFPGSGVGLATVQRIVERHGGRVWAEVKPGQGATFYLALPPPTVSPGSPGPFPQAKA